MNHSTVLSATYTNYSSTILQNGFSSGSDGKESASIAGDLGLIPGLGRSPGEGNGNPTPVFLPGEPQERGSLGGCRLWGRTESDMTEVT